MKKISLINILFILTLNVFGQFNLKINTWPKPVNPLKDGDTLSVAVDSLVSVKAVAINAKGDTLKNIQYEWFFGDNSYDKNGKDSISHAYRKEGGKYLRIIATDNDGNVKFAVIPVRVALTPDFEGTKADVEDKPVCKGEQVNLIGIAKSSKWMYKPITSKTEDKPAEIDSALSYISTITLESFKPGQKLENLDSLKKIRISIEHSDIPNLEIKLTCPNNTTLILKEKGGSNTIMLGEPLLISDKAGKTYDYSWSPKLPLNIPIITQIDSSDKVNRSGRIVDKDTNDIAIAVYTIKSGNYKSYEPLEKLIGCPLNGDWTLTVVDHKSKNNGYIGGWELNFADTFFTPLWSYENTYSPTDSSWQGDNVSSTTNEGKATAKPSTRGQIPYYYTVLDNWGFPHTFDISVDVTQADFTANKQENEYNRKGVEVALENTTKWAVSSIWDIAGQVQNNPANSITYTFNDNSGYVEDKRLYIIKLTAKSEQGCTDTISKIITVTVPKFDDKKERYNVFTANSNGFKLFGDTTSTEINFFRSAEGVIISRWGRIVKKWKSVDEILGGWNGKINDRYVESGVYYYIVEGIGINDKKAKVKGKVYFFKGD